MGVIAYFMLTLVHSKNSARGVTEIKYTRSRDALKAIRPEGWFIGNMREYASREFMCGLYQRSSAEMEIVSGDLPTEELAELHAIVQAIEYERRNRNRSSNV